MGQAQRERAARNGIGKAPGIPVDAMRAEMRPGVPGDPKIIFLVYL